MILVMNCHIVIEFQERKAKRWPADAKDRARNADLEKLIITAAIGANGYFAKNVMVYWRVGQSMSGPVLVPLAPNICHRAVTRT